MFNNITINPAQASVRFLSNIELQPDQLYVAFWSDDLTTPVSIAFLTENYPITIQYINTPTEARHAGVTIEYSNNTRDYNPWVRFLPLVSLTATY